MVGDDVAGGLEVLEGPLCGYATLRPCYDGDIAVARDSGDVVHGVGDVLSGGLGVLECVCGIVDVDRVCVGGSRKELAEVWSEVFAGFDAGAGKEQGGWDASVRETW